MKKTIIGVFIGLIMFSCKSQPDYFTVSGTLNNGAGEKLYFSELQTNKIAILDSVILENDGNFSFKGTTQEPKFYAIRTTPNNYITLIINPFDQIIIKGNAKNLSSTYTVQGSDESNKIRILRNRLTESSRILDEIGSDFSSYIGKPEFNKMKDSLSKKSFQVINDHKDYTKQFVVQNKNSLAGLMALYQQIGMRQYVLDPKADIAYFEMVDSALSRSLPKSDAVKALHAQVLEIKRQLNSEFEINSRVGIGVVAPEIALPNQDGDTIVLSSLKGKIVLVDFWASWCKPCRIENPILVKNYAKYHEKGFEIFQVSLDKSRSAWKSAIIIDSLNWTHVSDLQFWNSAPAKVYYVQSIPANFLLDKNGRIIAKNLRGDALEAKLSELFK
ncbi:MAG: redoxin domain-containing protein [Bacteroidales bacterium]